MSFARRDAWLAERKDAYSPKGSIGPAIRYSLGNWAELTRFVDDVPMPPDNDRSEVALRVAALGRKNFVFVGHEDPRDEAVSWRAMRSTPRVTKSWSRVTVEDQYLVARKSSAFFFGRTSSSWQRRGSSPTPWASSWGLVARSLCHHLKVHWDPQGSPSRSPRDALRPFRSRQ